MTKKIFKRLILGILSIIIPIILVGILVSKVYEYSLLKWVGLLICALGFYLSGLINQKTPIKFIPFLYISLFAFIPLRYFYLPLIIFLFLFATISLIITRKEIEKKYKIISLIGMLSIFIYFLFSQPLILRKGNVVEHDIYGDIKNGNTIWDFTNNKNKLLPNDTFLDINDNPWNIDSFKTKILYISFWATWCKPCIEQKPMLDNLKKEFEQNSDITFIDISLDKDSNSWRQFINKNKPKGIQLISMDEANTRALFEISGIPKHFVVNSKREFLEIYGSELAKIILIDSVMTNNYIHKKLEVTENKKTD